MDQNQSLRRADASTNLENDTRPLSSGFPLKRASNFRDINAPRIRPAVDSRSTASPTHTTTTAGYPHTSSSIITKDPAQNNPSSNKNNPYFQNIQVYANLTDDPTLDSAAKHKHRHSIKPNQDQTMNKDGEEETIIDEIDPNDPNIEHHHRHRHHHRHSQDDDPNQFPKPSGKGGPSVTTHEIEAMRNIIDEVENTHKQHKQGQTADEDKTPRSKRHSRKSDALSVDVLEKIDHRQHHRHSHREPEVEPQQTQEEPTTSHKHRHSHVPPVDASPTLQPPPQDNKDKTRLSVANESEHHHHHRKSREIENTGGVVQEPPPETRKERKSLKPEPEPETLGPVARRKSHHNKGAQPPQAMTSQPAPTAATALISNAEPRRKSRKSEAVPPPDSYKSQKAQELPPPPPPQVGPSPTKERRRSMKPQNLEPSNTRDLPPHRNHDEDKEPNFLIERYIQDSHTHPPINSKENGKGRQDSKDTKKTERNARKSFPYTMDSSIRNGLNSTTTSREKQAVEPMQTTQQNIPADIFRGSNSTRVDKDTNKNDKPPTEKLDHNCNTIITGDGENVAVPGRLPSFVFDPPPPPPQATSSQKPGSKKNKKGSSRSKSKSKPPHEQNFQTYMMTHGSASGGGGDLPPTTATRDDSLESEFGFLNSPSGSPPPDETNAGDGTTTLAEGQTGSEHVYSDEAGQTGSIVYYEGEGSKVSPSYKLNLDSNVLSKPFICRRRKVKSQKKRNSQQTRNVANPCSA